MREFTFKLVVKVDAAGSGGVYLGDEPIAEFRWTGRHLADIFPELPANLVVSIETVLWAMDHE